MDTIFMNSENSKTSEPHILKLKLTDKLDLRLDKRVIALSNVSMYHTWNNIKISYNNNRFKISIPTWNEKIYITRWILLYIRYSRLFSIYFEEAWRKYR